MFQQQLHEYNLKIEKQNDTLFVYDSVRRKKVVLTPEEWVRQQFLQFLIQDKGMPVSLIAIEKKLVLHKLTKRADIVVFDSRAKPKIVVECKSPSVAITQAVFDQAAHYNVIYKAEFLVVTNGTQYFCSKLNFENNSFIFVNDIPHFNTF